jgi:hypothetical protein
VKVPSLSSTQDTVLYLYYGKAGATDVSDVDNTWDSNFKLVYHLTSNSSNNIIDSTSNSYDGTASGTTVADGQIGKCLQFASGNSITVTSGYTNTLKNTTTNTVSMWLYLTQFSSDGAVLVDKSNQDMGLFFEIEGGGGIYWVSNNSYMFYNRPTWLTWNHVVFVKTGDGNSGSLYVNGTLLTSFEGSIANYPSTDGDLVFGKYHGGSGWNFIGYLEEIRISNTVRSENWIKTEYANQNSPSTFYTVGSEVQAGNYITSSVTGGEGSTTTHVKILTYLVDTASGGSGTISPSNAHENLSISSTISDGTGSLVSSSIIGWGYGSSTALSGSGTISANIILVTEDTSLLVSSTYGGTGTTQAVPLLTSYISSSVTGSAGTTSNVVLTYKYISCSALGGSGSSSAHVKRLAPLTSSVSSTGGIASFNILGKFPLKCIAVSGVGGYIADVYLIGGSVGDFTPPLTVTITKNSTTVLFN